VVWHGQGAAWRANELYSGPHNGKEGMVRVGDCLLDIQELHSDGNWGRKYDVFAKDLKKAVMPRLMGPAGSTVELSFRRILSTGHAFIVTVKFKRGAPASKKDIKLSRVNNSSADSQNRFHELDKDGSGDISLEEVMKYLQKHPLPGQTHAWESALMLFQRADRDQSGSIDVGEFEEAFVETLERINRRAAEKAHQQSLVVEDSFQESLEDMRSDLLDTIRIITRPYMLRLQRMVGDPEDLYMIHSMYKLSGESVKDVASGTYTLQTFMLDRNPAHFWKCFLRILKSLHKAQYKLGASAEEEMTNEEEEEIAIEEVKKLIKVPSRLTTQAVAAQKSTLPLIKNLVGRSPGRGIPVRQWDKFDPHADLFDLQRQYAMPDPFLGRNDAVLHVLSCLPLHRLSTIVGECASGKTCVAKMVIYTLQQRAAEAADGRYLYREGVFQISCATVPSLQQLVFETAGIVGRLTSDEDELVLAICDKNLLIVYDGVDGLLADKTQSVLFKTFLEKVLQGVPGLSVLCTCARPLGVPYENIIGLNKLSDSELASLIRADGLANFHSGDKICIYFNGNPLAARSLSA